MNVTKAPLDSPKDASRRPAESGSDRRLADSGENGEPYVLTDPLLGEGSVLDGKYRLTRCLGSGGMGTVWAARNEFLDTEVAIKFIRADLDHELHRKRLLVEAQSAARLAHPNIVQIFDVSHTPDGRPFIVMEMLRGRDLGKAVRYQGKMAPVTAVRTLLPVAQALAVAHEAGIVHRDLKPENIFLAEQDDVTRPMLLDFGIAKSRAVGADRLTEAGTWLGSPQYMSPEQARGEDVDYSADVWAFSMLLYEAVTGDLPFADSNYNRLLHKVIELPLPHFTVYGLREEALFAIVERGLRKTTLERWQSMRTMGLELARWLLAQGIEEDISNTAVRPTWMPVVRSSHLPLPLVLKPEADGLASKPTSSQTETPGSYVAHWWRGRTRLLWTVAGIVLFAIVGMSLKLRVPRAGRTTAVDLRRSVAPDLLRSAVVPLPMAAPSSTLNAKTVIAQPNALPPVAATTSSARPTKVPVQPRRTATQPNGGLSAPTTGPASEPSALDIKTDF